MLCSGATLALENLETLATGEPEFVRTPSSRSGCKVKGDKKISIDGRLSIFTRRVRFAHP